MKLGYPNDQGVFLGVAVRTVIFVVLVVLICVSAFTRWVKR